MPRCCLPTGTLSQTWCLTGTCGPAPAVGGCTGLAPKSRYPRPWRRTPCLWPALHPAAAAPVRAPAASRSVGTPALDQGSRLGGQFPHVSGSSPNAGEPGYSRREAPPSPISGRVCEFENTGGRAEFLSMTEEGGSRIRRGTSTPRETTPEEAPEPPRTRTPRYSYCTELHAGRDATARPSAERQQWALSCTAPRGGPPREVGELLRGLSIRAVLEPLFPACAWSAPIKPVSWGKDNNATQTKHPQAGQARRTGCPSTLPAERSRVGGSRGGAREQQRNQKCTWPATQQVCPRGRPRDTLLPRVHTRGVPVAPQRQQRGTNTRQGPVPSGTQPHQNATSSREPARSPRRGAPDGQQAGQSRARGTLPQGQRRRTHAGGLWKDTEVGGRGRRMSPI